MNFIYNDFGKTINGNKAIFEGKKSTQPSGLLTYQTAPTVNQMKPSQLKPLGKT